MVITNVRVNLAENAGEKNYKGTASVTFDGCFVVSGIGIIRRGERMHVSMPRRRIGSDRYESVAFPVTVPARTMIEEAVLAGYERTVEESEAESSAKS